MRDSIRAAVCPLYLFACLILGGSGQGIWQNILLQLAGLGLLAWAAAQPSTDPLPPFANRIAMIAIASLALVILQLVPLPFSLWSTIGPRRELASGYQVLGLLPAAMPLSLTPYRSLAESLAIVPPLALFFGIVRLRAYRPNWMALALGAATTCGIFLGSLQVTSPSRISSWYLYSDTNFGSAVGFFANANHMGLLLVLNLPFLAAIAAMPRPADPQRYSARLALVGAATLVLFIGVALNGSFAAYALAVPVLVASALIAFPASPRLQLLGITAAILLMVGAVAALEISPVGTGKFTEQAASSVDSREQIFSTTARAVRDFFPFGSGLGSFQNVYRLYEDPDRVTDTYVVHAHNDYLELALEMGLAGMLLLALFLASWGKVIQRVWRSPQRQPFRRAAAVASAAILVHTFVDFPLRTAAISALFAMCLGFLADPRSISETDTADLRPLRHRVFR